MVMTSNNLTLKERFNKIREQKKPESWTEYAGRVGQQLNTRVGETVVGQPGAFKKAYQQTKDAIGNFFFPDQKSLSELEKEALGESEKGSLSDTFFNPLTPQELRENVTPKISEKKYGSKTHLEPRNKGEEIAGDLTQDLASFFMPGTDQLRMAVRIGAPIAGNLTKQGLEYLGVEPTTAEKAKLGVMLATTLAGQSNPGQFAADRIQQAKQMVPQNATFNVGNLANRFLPLYNRLRQGLRTPSKSRAMQGMEDLANQVQNNRMSLHNLMRARDDINEWISEAGGFDVPREIRDRTVRNLNDFKRNVIETINEELGVRFPEAAELYQTGYEAAAVNHQSNAISNFIQRHYGKTAASVSTKLLFPAIGGGALYAPKIAAGTIAAYPIYNTGKVLYRISQSPTLGRYYSDVIRYSVQGNAPAMIKSMDKLDNALKKDEKKREKGKKKTLDQFRERFKKKDSSHHLLENTEGTHQIPQ